jgi:hypothetical protein
MNESDISSRLLLRAGETLHEVLTEMGWNPQRDDETAGFLVDFEPPYIPVAHAFAAISGELELFVFYLNLGVAAAPERRDETAKFLMLANWKLMSGNFEMDYKDGLIRLRSSVCFRGTELSKALIRGAILLAMNAVDRYAKGAIEVMARGKTAEQAFSETVTAGGLTAG